MDDVLIINGERYRKCPYIEECFEKTLQGEQFEILAVMPEYSYNYKVLTLRLSYPVDMRFNAGEKIIISKVMGGGSNE